MNPAVCITARLPKEAWSYCRSASWTSQPAEAADGFGSGSAAVSAADDGRAGWSFPGSSVLLKSPPVALSMSEIESLCRWGSHMLHETSLKRLHDWVLLLSITAAVGSYEGTLHGERPCQPSHQLAHQWITVAHQTKPLRLPAAWL